MIRVREFFLRKCLELYAIKIVLKKNLYNMKYYNITFGKPMIRNIITYMWKNINIDNISHLPARQGTVKYQIFKV